jgi:uncharacterized membrane protein
MRPALVVILLWVLFAGTHFGLSSQRVRTTLVERLGELGFLALFYTVASACLTALVAAYAPQRFDGAPGLALAGIPALRWALWTVSGLGLILAGPTLLVYPRLPTALFAQPTWSPRGTERITRHPFFVGFALFALAHALLATRLVGTVFFGGFAFLALAGAHHQDQRLVARWGKPYADYLGATSVVPFAAVVAGRQRLVWRELPAEALTGIGVALALRTWHENLFARGGVWFIGFFVSGSMIFGVSAWRRSRRIAARADRPPRA